MKIKDLLETNKLASGYFIRNLRKSGKVQEYVYDRIDKKTASKFGIGYAPKAGLFDLLSDSQLGLSPARQLGLIGQNDDGGYFELFRERVVIPIVHGGLIVGFGARDLTGHAQSKYLNSKNSILYSKGSTLYGLWQAIRHIEERGYAILVEGYFDVLPLVSNEIKNVVASCGTAFKTAHADVLRLFTDHVCVLYDGDGAGEKAAKKAEKILKLAGIHRDTIVLPDGLDPDEYVKIFGKEKLLKLIS